jgi:hypothetical protein
MLSGVTASAQAKAEDCIKRRARSLATTCILKSHDGRSSPWPNHPLTFSTHMNLIAHTSQQYPRQHCSEATR